MHLRAYVFQEETLFRGDLGAASHEAKSAFLQLIFQFGELPLSGKAGSERIILLPVKLHLLEGRAAGNSDAGSAARGSRSPEM